MAKEYIERDAVLKEQKTFTEYDEGGWDAKVAVVEVADIKAIPTADVVEVVRCRDCKHFTEGMAVGMCKRNPGQPIMPMPYDNYCGFGERRDSDGR